MKTIIHVWLLVSGPGILLMCFVFVVVVFKSFVGQYTGSELRFKDVHYIASAPVRLYHRKQTDIQRYLLNYMGRDRRYSEQMRNCQTFSADFYGFMAGKANVEPFHKVCRLSYSNRGHNFLYSPEMYGAPHK